MSKTAMRRSIVDLMKTPAEVRDIQWLQQALQNAVDLELSTLPPYLCGMWSIQDGSGPVYDLIHSVVMEEMLHMGLACNMLTTIGGTPAIDSSIPAYPGPLPGGVRPQLTVYLAGLSKDYLKDVFMQIEYPEAGPIALALGETYPTIGAFYDAVANAFGQNQSSITGERQLTASVGGKSLFAITDLASAEKAISEIKQQGEGTSQSPLAVDFGGELAHYYKYAEIWHGNTLVQQDGKWVYAGDAIPFPTVYPMTPIPAGGYVNPAANVQTALDSFNGTFTQILQDLQTAWATGAKKNLGEAIGNMFGLSSAATAIMQFELPDKSGVYGPDFLLAS